MNFSAKFLLLFLLLVYFSLVFIFPFLIEKKALDSFIAYLLPFIGGLSYYTVMKYQAELRLAKDTASENLTKDNRKSILFLRSFNVDSLKCIRPITFKGLVPWDSKNINTKITLEEAISDNINQKIGPFIALGNPTDKIPTLGAYKDYIDDDWKKLVKKYCNKSSLILVLEGQGDGLAWELEYIRKNISHKKILFLSHPKPFVSNSDIFVAFATLLKKCGYVVPHISTYTGNIYYVDEMWRLQILGEDINRINEYVSVIEEYHKGIKNG